MNFSIAAGELVVGELWYDQHDLGFGFTAADPVIAQRGTEGVELMWGSVALQADRASGDVLGLWGYHPDALWKSGTLSRPAAAPGRLRASIDDAPPIGVALRVAAATNLVTTRDLASGWIRIAVSDLPAGNSWVEFASAAVAELAGTALVALWLRPSWRPVSPS